MTKTQVKGLIWLAVAACEISYMLVFKDIGAGMFWIFVAGFMAVDNI